MVSGKKIGHTLLLFFLMLGGSSTSQSLIKKYFYTNHHLRMLNAKPVDATSFLVAVQTDDGRSGIIKFNSNGDTVWTYFVSGVIPEVFYPANGNGTFAVKADKGCIFIHTPVNHDRFFLTELDSNGAVISSKFYSGPSCNEYTFYRLTHLSDGSILLLFDCDEIGAFNNYIIKFDTNGSTSRYWLNSNGPYIPYDIFPNANGTYYFTGNNTLLLLDSVFNRIKGCSFSSSMKFGEIVTIINDTIYLQTSSDVLSQDLTRLMKIDTAFTQAITVEFSNSQMNLDIRIEPGSNYIFVAGNYLTKSFLANLDNVGNFISCKSFYPGLSFHEENEISFQLDSQVVLLTKFQDSLSGMVGFYFYKSNNDQHFCIEDSCSFPLIWDTLALFSGGGGNFNSSWTVISDTNLSTVQIPLEWNNVCMITGLNEEIIPRECTVSPNPAENELYVDNLNLRGREVLISDILGRSWKLPVSSAGQERLLIDTQMLESGLYFLRTDNCIVKFLRR